MARPREPFVWSLFSAGGMVSALVLPALVAVLWVAAPLGWTDAASHGNLLPLAAPLLVRAGLAGLVLLGLFHWAHRFRYTLYDGLQLYHLNQLIAVLTYGIATVLSLAAIWLLLLAW